MIKTKEFYNDMRVDDLINEWLEEHSNVAIIDIKFSANENGSQALIVYTEN